MFVVDVAAYFEDAELSWENDDLCWWHSDEIDALDLHTGIAGASAKLRQPTSCVEH